MEIDATQNLMAVSREISSSARAGASSVPDDAERTALRKACAEMESLFVFHLLKEMRATVPREGLIQGGMGEEVFTSLMDGELARTISLEQGLGLARLLETQLTRYLASDPADSSSGSTRVKI